MEPSTYTGCPSPEIAHASGVTKLPQELIDEIVDYLRDDKGSLSACTLVLNSLQHSARRYLLAEVYVHNIQNCDVPAILECIRAAPVSFASNIHTLNIHYVSWSRPGSEQLDLYALADAASLLPRLHTLSVYTYQAGYPKLLGEAVPEPDSKPKPPPPPIQCTRLSLELKHLRVSKWKTFLRSCPSATELDLRSDCYLPKPKSRPRDRVLREDWQAISTMRIARLDLGTFFGSSKTASPYEFASLLDTHTPIFQTLQDLSCHRVLADDELPHLAKLLKRRGSTIRRMYFDLRAVDSAS